MLLAWGVGWVSARFHEFVQDVEGKRVRFASRADAVLGQSGVAGIMGALDVSTRQVGVI
jgi:hypothetical protein